ncbi:MAG: cache domain-containing protein [Flavobacteriaceae bacterium]|nr:cache domain-containing protein [Flavobacteriaceae bacterium]
MMRFLLFIIVTLFVFASCSNDDADDIKELQTQVSSLQSLKTQLESKIAQLENQIKGLPSSADVTKLQGEISGLKNQGVSTQEELGEANTRIDALLKQIAALELEVNPPTAQGVVDEETLKTFVQWYRSQFIKVPGIDQDAIYWQQMRTEGSDLNSGSTFLIIFERTGEAFVHGADRSAEGKNLLEVVDDNGKKVVEELFKVALQPEGGFVKYLDGGKEKTAYAVTYTPKYTGVEVLLVGGYSQDVSHVAYQYIDLPKPEVTASQVVDRETLITFVEGVKQVILDGFASPTPVPFAKFKNTFRREGGYFKSGSVYLWVVSQQNINLFHGANIDLENRSTNFSRTDINGKRFIEELIVGARTEGQKFVEYYYDDPSVVGDEDTGSPKLGYAVKITVPYGATPVTFVLGSGIYTGER